MMSSIIQNVPFVWEKLLPKSICFTWQSLPIF